MFDGCLFVRLKCIGCYFEEDYTFDKDKAYRNRDLECHFDRASGVETNTEQIKIPKYEKESEQMKL